MSMNFGLTTEALVGGATYLPAAGPVGSVYQPTAFFPRDPRAGQIAGGIGATPAPSNFGGIKQPRQLWNTLANHGNPLAVYTANRNNSTG